MLNMFVGSGRICTQPAKRGDDNNPIAGFRIAIDNSGKGEQRKTLFLDCTCFGKLSLAVLVNLDKGARVNVRGRLCQDDYINENGQQVRKFYLAVDGIDFLDPKKKDEPAQAKEVADEDLPF